MAHQYYINGERGTTETEENTDEKFKRVSRDKQLLQYGTATFIQWFLFLMGIGSGISAHIAMFNGNNDKWFTRDMAMLICFGFVGVIAAIKSLFKHESSDDRVDK